jgi:predicted HTH domain antitoxin
MVTIGSWFAGADCGAPVGDSTSTSKVGAYSSRSLFQMATISFDLPDSVERHLATLSDNVDAAAKEAAVVELYRQGQLSHGALAESLGMTRTEVDSLLTRHGVTEDLPTVADFREQLEAIRNRLRR